MMVVLFSPTHKFESKILKTLFFERFRKYICQLLFCILLAAVHLTPDLVGSIYAAIALRETVRIVVIYDALHGLDL